MSKPSENPSKSIIAKFFRGFGFAISGLRWMVRTQINARFHLLAAAVVLLLGWMLRVSNAEWALLGLCIGSVLSAEAFNTAIEQLSDAVSTEPNERIGRAKDLGSGAVLLAALFSAIAGSLIFVPKLWMLIS